jgi:hypothetical protein
VGKLKKLIIWLVVAFCVYAIFKSPDQAAGIVKTGANGIGSGVAAIGRFFNALLAR